MVIVIIVVTEVDGTKKIVETSEKEWRKTGKVKKKERKTKQNYGLLWFYFFHFLKEWSHHRNTNISLTVFSNDAS